MLQTQTPHTRIGTRAAAYWAGLMGHQGRLQTLRWQWQRCYQRLWPPPLEPHPARSGAPCQRISRITQVDAERAVQGWPLLSTRQYCFVRNQPSTSAAVESPNRQHTAHCACSCFCMRPCPVRRIKSAITGVSYLAQAAHRTSSWPRATPSRATAASSGSRQRRCAALWPARGITLTRRERKGTWGTCRRCGEGG